jgi:hypothetical protein
MTRVGLATCAGFPDLDDDDRLLLPELASRGITGIPVVWDDPDVDWAALPLVVLRNTWDYAERRAEFLDWLGRVASVTDLLNPLDVVVWNTDKRYLRDLADVGLPVVDTVFLEPPASGSGEDLDAVASGWVPPAGAAQFVVKPAVSAGSRDTVRYLAGESLDAARAHLRRLLGDGRVVMVQPYLDAVDTVGETALLFVDGEFSHAIRKGPLLQEPGVQASTVAGLFVAEQIDSRQASAAEREIAEQVLAAVPGGADRLLYARVDLIPGSDGWPRLLELELTEPSLFLAHGGSAAEHLAAAIDMRLSGPRS